MVNAFPAQLFLWTFDEELSRSTLHVAILKGSRTLICALVEKLKALCGGDDSKLVEHEFILKEDKFGLSAADMASLIANKEIISCFEQRLQVFDYLEGDTPFRQSPTSEDEKRDLFEKASPFLEKQAPSAQSSIQEWLSMNNIDFVYLLHAALNYDHVSTFVELIYDTGDFSFLEPLFNVRDSVGKSPLHNCDNFVYLKLLKILSIHFPDLDWNMPDFNGRTPLHWAAAQGDFVMVRFLARQGGTKLNATYSNSMDGKVKQNINFNDGGVKDATPLHLAVIHNHVSVVEVLLKVPKERGLDVNAICKRQYKFQDYTSDKKAMTPFTPIQLAAFMGHVQILKIFLKDPRLYDPGLKNIKKSDLEEHDLIPALHYATSQFHPLAVKALVDCTRIDTLVKDQFDSTALHYAAQHAHGRSQVHASLFDYVTVSHFTSKPPISRKPSDHDIITCIDILMQSGLDMEQKNEGEMTPTLHPSCPEKVKIWWLEKIAKEAQENKNNLIIAANAILVTAALVATASFVGPLQPPLGLFDDGNQTWLDGYS